MADKQVYNPLFFLASLGAGGLAVTFFMYLMFMTPHKETPIPTFDSLIAYFNQSEIIVQVLLVLAILGIVFFAFKHIKVLIWNLKQYFAFKKTEGFEKLRTTNAEVTLMAMPLTLAMTVNVMFILGAVFIPGLWGIIEYMFPAAIVAFAAIGVLALKIFGEYFTRLLTKGDFDFVANNSLAQMVAVFAFAMIAVGFAAPAAMSHNDATVAIALSLSTFFATISVFLAFIKVILGFKSMFKQGVALEAAPSLWIIIPILTLIGITFVRQQHGLHSTFDLHMETGGLFVLTSVIISLQLFFGFIGYKVMKANNYFKDYIHGDKKSPGSYALVCPGVALMVFGFFFVHLGFVKTGIVDKFGIMYFIMLAPFIYLQLLTIRTVFKLNKKMF